MPASPMDVAFQAISQPANPAGFLNPLGLFTSILGTTIGGLLGSSDLWSAENEAARVAQMNERLAEWIKNNPTMPDGSPRARGPVDAPSAPGYVKDEQGYFRNTNDPTDQGYYVISGNTPIKVTPPLVPVPKPTTGAGASGGASSGGSGGSNQPTFGAEQGGMNAPVDMDGGFVDLGIDPDLVGGFPDTGTGDPTNPSGPTPADQPPVERSADEWYDIISDWFIRFPNASKEEAIAAGQSVNVPTDILNETIAQQFPSSGTGGTSGNGSGGSGSGSGSGTGTGGGSGTPTAPTVPTVPPVQPSDGSGGGVGGGTSPNGETGTGTGTGGGGTGTGTNGFTGMLSQSPMMDDLFQEELWTMKTPKAKVLDSLLTYGYNPGMFFR